MKSSKDWFSLQLQSVTLLLVNLFLGVFAGHAQTTTWVATSGGNWNATSSWDNGIANNATAIAIFNAVNGQAYNVSIFKNESFTVGTLDLVGDVGGGPILNTTSGTLKFDGAAMINVETHPGAGSGINVNLVFLHNATINTSTPDSLLNTSSPTVTGTGVSLTKIGPGEVQFGSDAAISLTGPLNVNGGTLTIFNALDVGIPSGAKANVGNLEITGATVNVAGKFSLNSGGTLSVGTGFAINGPFAGGGFVPNGPLTADGGTIRTLAAVSFPNEVTLAAGGVILDSNGFDSTFSGAFSSTGALTKANLGTITLLNDNTYSGGTLVRDGTLIVGTLDPTVEVSTALGSGAVTLEGGTLRTTSATTGNPLTIHIGGNYIQRSGATLALGIGGLQGEQYDHVQVDGSASLGGTLVVSSLNGFRPANLNFFEVLRANGGRSGEFATVTDNLNIDSNLQRVDIYAPNGAAILYIATAVPTPTPSPAPSPTPAPPKPPVIDVIPNPLPPVNPEEPLPISFLLAALNPTAEQLTSMFEVPFSGANTQRFNLNDRMAQIQRGSTGFVSPIPPAAAPPSGKETIGEGKGVAPPPVFQQTPQNRWGVWVSGWGDWVSVDNDNGIKGYDFTTGGVSGGVDYRITDCLAVGIFGTYAHTWTSLSPGDVDVNTGRGGLYATYWNQGFYVNGGVYGGHNSYDTSRQTLLQGDFANGSTSGYEFSTFVETGYDFHFGNLSFGPVFAAQYTNVHIDSYTERALFLPLNIHSDSEESWTTDLGIQASYPWHVGQITVIPSLWAAWEHEYKYSALPITFSAANFPGGTATTFGPNEGHDSFIINAGAGVQWTPRISTYVGYQGKLSRSNYSANGVTGTISVSF
jgi:outer membrane autotransporter protein